MVIWSLFDGSGIMGLDWAKAGHTVFCFNADTADHGEYEIKMQHPNLHYVNHWIDEAFDPVGAVVYLDGNRQVVVEKPDMIFAFPSCTELAHSGAQHERDESAVELAVNNAKLVEKLGLLYGCPWMVENPVGLLSTKWRKPNAYFHPFEYGGYMREDEKPYHPKMPAFDGYTKKTCLWFGNGFVMPTKCPGPVNIGFFWAWKYLGGKSARTKQLRSLTPRGFARAVMIANAK